MFSQDSIRPPLIIKEQNPLAKLSSNSGQKTLQNPSLLMGTGLLHLTSPMMHTYSHSRTEQRNSSCINSTYYNTLLPSTSPSIHESLRLIEPSESESPNGATCSFPASVNSVICKPCTSTTTVLPNQDVSPVAGQPIPQINSLLRNKTNRSRIGIKESVGEGEIVTTSTSANCATKKDTLATSVRLRAL